MSLNVNDLIGKQIEDITIESVYLENGGKTLYNCKCSCGKTCIRKREYLLKGNVKNCGSNIHRYRVDVNDIVGNTYGELKVISFSRRDGNKIFYNCRCSCGKNVEIIRGSLIFNLIKSCGHLSLNRLSKDELNELVGKKINELTVLEYAYRKDSNIFYKCRCSCGKECFIRRTALLNKTAISCGHAKVEHLSMDKINEVIGKTFNELTIISFSHRNKGNIFYNCHCSCGKDCIVSRNQLLSGRKKSCGHLNHISIADDIVGKRFGRLVVMKLLPKNNPNDSQKYLCKCDCGNTKVIRRDALIKNRTISCGCYSSEVHSKLLKTHGFTNTRFYKIWNHMKRRCFNPNDDAYHYYGERGITICDRWLIFDNFKNDMYDSYIEHVKKYGEKDTTINRIDNDGNYEPNNCKWATMKEQANNNRSNIIVNIDGNNYTLMQAFEKYALPELDYGNVRDRIEAGMDVEDALTKPININFSRGEKRLKRLSITKPIEFFDPDNPPEEYLEAKKHMNF